MKKAVYFPIDATDSNTTKSAEIIMNYNYNGYGIYITLLQKLVNTKTRTLPYSKLKAIAFDMHCSLDDLQPIVDNFFDIDKTEDIFYCEELNEKMHYYDDKYNAASEGGKKAAANMSQEQRQARAKKAISNRWQKNQENNLKTEIEEQLQSDEILSTKNDILTSKNDIEKQIQDLNYDDLPDIDDKILTTKNDILTSKYEIQTPLVSDTNNRIKENRIEKKEIEKEKKEKEQNEKEQNEKEQNKIELNKTEPKSNLEFQIESSYFPKDLLNKIYNQFQIDQIESRFSLTYTQYEHLIVYLIITKMKEMKIDTSKDKFVNYLSTNFYFYEKTLFPNISNDIPKFRMLEERIIKEISIYRIN